MSALSQSLLLTLAAATTSLSGCQTDEMSPSYNDDRADHNSRDVVAMLNSWNIELSQEDIQSKYCKMASSALIARENGNLSEKRLGDVIDEFSDSYLDTMEDFVGNTDENDLIFTRSEFDEPLRSFMGKVKDKKSRLKALEKWTVVDGGDRKFNMDLDRLAPVDSLLDADIRFGMASYGESLSGGRIQ